jgi:Holliday junction resolvase RusA-like endonuclease
MLRFQVNYKPTPLKRPRLVKSNIVYDPSKKDKKDWLNLCRKYAPPVPLAGPLRMNIEFYFARPKCHYRTGKYSKELKATAPHIHTNMPDIDNLSKFILDAMNAVFYEDDRQVVELNSHKEYLNDQSNKVGYCIVTVLPYEKKAAHFTTFTQEIVNLVSENLQAKVTGMFQVEDSSSENMLEGSSSENISTEL